MNLWLITNIRILRHEPLPSHAIQNLQTAAALAELGHGVLVWVGALEGAPDGGGRGLIEERLGRPLPGGVRLLAYRPRGAREEKKTPFASPLARLINTLRARLAAPPPEAVITRSPRLLAQLHGSWLRPAGARLILEYQYPEWAQLWRAWRKRNPAAPLGACVARLREWRRREDAWLALADGILYAASGHKLLLEQAQYAGPAEWIPSGCLPPELAPVGKAADAPQEYDVGFVGSLAPENGLECLLEALGAMDRVNALVVGGGPKPYVEALKRRAGQLGLDARVTFAGALAFGAVRAQMRRCRVGVAPISHRRGPEKRQFASPLKLIEWMAAGAAVVATAVPSVFQQAVDGRNALLVPPESPGALAGAIGRLLRDEALRTRLAQGGLASAGQAAYPNRAQIVAGFIERLRRR